MNVKEIVNHHDAMRSRTADEEEIETFLEDLQYYLNRMEEKAKEIVVSRMDEGDFVKTIRIVKNAILSSEECNNNAVFMMLDLTGSLEPLLHTVILSMLGILADEEVI